MSVPSPLVIWLMSLGALTLALRARRKERVVVASAVPGWVSLARRVPSPEALRRRAMSERLAADFSAARLDASIDAAGFCRCRAGVAIASAVTAVPAAITHPAGVVLVALLSGAGWFLPAAWVRRRAVSRRAQVVRDLPDLIDLVVICTRAGMALEPSLRLGVERQTGPLADEIVTTLTAFDLGTPRREGLRDLSDRMGCVELTGLVGALLQAEELGTPIAVVLARQAELLRAARTQLLREHAAKAAPKVQLVVAMVMVPAALLVVLGVLVIRLLGEIGGINGGGLL